MHFDGGDGMCVLASTQYCESIKKMHISVKFYYVTPVNCVKSTDVKLLLFYDFYLWQLLLFNVLSYFLCTCRNNLQKYGY